MITGKIELFRPKDLKRILGTVATTPGVHPDLEDVRQMAEDTVVGAAGLRASPEQREAARQTIAEVEAVKEKSSCQSTPKS